MFNSKFEFNSEKNSSRSRWLHLLPDNKTLYSIFAQKIGIRKIQSDGLVEFFLDYRMAYVATFFVMFLLRNVRFNVRCFGASRCFRWELISTKPYFSCSFFQFTLIFRPEHKSKPYLGSAQGVTDNHPRTSQRPQCSARVFVFFPATFTFKSRIHSQLEVTVVLE